MDPETEVGSQPQEETPVESAPIVPEVQPEE